MNQKYRPLEESLTILEDCAKRGDVVRFKNESDNFYSWMPRLESLRHLAGDQVTMLVRHYQSRYDQIKLLLGSRR